MQSSVRRLLNNLGVIILSLLLAFVIWVSATLQADPFDTHAVPNVPITIVNQPENTVLLEPISDSVLVSVRAPSSVLADLEVSDFEATMDLTEVEPGTATLVPVRVTTSNPDVRIEGWDPEAQTVQLEMILTAAIAVELEIQGEVATGYESNSAIVIPNQVQVTGPESLLSQVTIMEGSIDIEGAREDVVEQVVVKPLDAEGRLVPGLQWAPDRVQVRVPVQRRLGFKPDVEVVPDVRGEPEPGYRLGSVSVAPSTVTLFGLPSVLNQLPGFVETLPISVTGATEDLLEYSFLKVPDTVAVVGADFVTVTVEVLPIQSSRPMTVPVEIQGLRAEWIAIPSPDVVNVILEGPDLVITDLTSGDVRAIVDLFGYTPGVYRVEPNIVAPESVTVVSIIPETIEVVIAPSPTPTPTLTVSPTVVVTGTAEP
jgi:YbbR domain-containing protein